MHLHLEHRFAAFSSQPVECALCLSAHSVLQPRWSNGSHAAPRMPALHRRLGHLHSRNYNFASRVTSPMVGPRFRLFAVTGVSCHRPCHPGHHLPARGCDLQMQAISPPTRGFGTFTGRDYGAKHCHTSIYFAVQRRRRLSQTIAATAHRLGGNYTSTIPTTSSPCQEFHINC